MKQGGPKFGDIYFADLVAHGCVQGGRRPVLIAQNDVGNLHSPVIGIIPISSKMKSEYMPTHTVIPANEISGLRTDSVVLVEQTQTINQDQLKFKIGSLTHKELVDVGRALSVQFPFPVV